MIPWWVEWGAAGGLFYLFTVVVSMIVLLAKRP